MKRFAALATAIAVIVLASPCAFAQTASAPSIPPASAETSAAPAIDIAEFLKPYAAASKACLDLLEKAARLSTQGKWMSAYRAIDDFDKANTDPYALAMKTSLVLRGAVRSDLHRSFGLADLEKGQDLESLRNAKGDYTPIPFDPPALADTQAANGVPAPGILSKELGDYYFDVLSRFSGQWAISDDEILAKIVENYAKAYAAGIFDIASLVNHAESLVRLNRADDSEPIYRKAMELEPKSANVFYSYAMSLSFRDKKTEALAEIDKAIEFYGEDSTRINAIALGARTAAELGDDAKVQRYYALADEDYPDSPTPGVLRHMVAIETGNKSAASDAADSLVSAYGSNPNVIRTLISTWYSAGDATAARDFLQRNIAKGGEDLTVATLNFYLVVLLSQGSPSDEDRAVALKALDEAEARFKTVFGPENQVYGVITDMRASLQPKAPDPAPGAGAQ